MLSMQDVCAKRSLKIVKRELGIRRSIEVLQGYRIQIPMTAGILKPCVFLPVEDMEEEQLKTCILP